MAKRNKNHIIGDAAVNAIKTSLIPKEWIVNTQTSDYGLDMLVEIVEENMTTGKMFFVQAKGIDKPSNKGLIHFPFPVERLKDYKSVSLPVLLIVYSCQDNLFWGKWVNPLFDLLSSKQQEQQSYNIKLSSHNIIDQEYLRSVGELFSNSIPNGICLRASNHSRKTDRILRQVMKKSGSLFRSGISDSNRLSCIDVHIKLSYEQGILTAIIHDEFRHKFHFSGPIIDEAVLYYNTLPDSDCPDILWSIILAIAYFEKDTDKTESFDIITGHISPTFLSSLSDFEWLSFLSGTPKESIYNLDRFLRLCAETGRAELLTLSLIFVFRTSDGDYNFIYPHLFKIYDNEPDLEKKGLLAYNIANAFRVSDLSAMHQAASWYFIAIRSFPAYRRCEYWWQEMGSVLYNTGHYIFAELFYKKARSISKERCYSDISMLIADCLIKQKKIADAESEILSFINELEDNKEDVKSSILLKAQAITLFKDTIDAIDDPLYTVAWFNRGVDYANRSRYEAALPCFLIAWILNDSDMESLINAMISALNIKETKIVTNIIWAVKELYGEDGYNYIVSMFLKQNDMPEQVRDYFIDTLHGILFNYDVPRINSHQLTASFDSMKTLSNK